jgi:hypothetical protein
MIGTIGYFFSAMTAISIIVTESDIMLRFEEEALSGALLHGQRV